MIPTPDGRYQQRAHFTEAQPIALVKNGDGNNGNHIQLAVEVPLMVLATSTVAVRLYSRISVKRKLAVDDILILLGLICAFSRTIISCMSADDVWSFDRNGPDHASEIPYYQHIFERRICYILASVFTRCSVLAYYLRIFPPGLTSLRRLSWVLLVLALVQFTEVFTVLLVFCKDISKLWGSDFLSFSGSRCFSSSTYSYSAAIGDSVLDCLIFALPIPYVWSLRKLRARQRFGLIIIFALGLSVCAVALLQIPFIQRREHSPTYFGGSINLLVAIQLSLAIIAASLPDIRALIARSWPNFSPLHHRSLNTVAPRNGGERGRRDEEMAQEGSLARPRLAFDGRRLSRKPDWMRSTLPQSLMSTRVTQNEVTRDGSNESVIPPVPGSVELLPTPEEGPADLLPTNKSTKDG